MTTAALDAVVSQAVILVGGLGTRLGERTRSTPKPLLDVGGRAFLDHLLDEVTRYPTIRNVVLLAGFQATQVEQRYHGRRWRHADIAVMSEPAPLGTGGALRNAAVVLEERFLLLNGDSYFDFNLLDLAACEARSPALLRMALKTDHPGDRYGRIVLAGDRVTRFVAPGAGARGPMNAGVYLAKRDVLGFIDAGGARPVSLEQEVFPRLAEQGQLAASLYDGYFIDIGVPDDLQRAQHELDPGRTRPAVFLDRDGVLNVDRGYVHRIEDFEWIEGAPQAVKLCNDLGYYVFVVTNQAGIARGYYRTDAVEALHAWMSVELARSGAHIEAFEYCPYHVNGVVPEFSRPSHRRKPAPGMIEACFAAWPVDRSRSLLVGDKASDIEAAVAAGIAGHLFGGGDLERFLRPLLC